MNCTRFFWLVVPFVASSWVLSLTAQDGSAPPTAETSAKIPVLGQSGETKLQGGDTKGAIADFTQAFELSRQLVRANPQDAATQENAYYYLCRLAAAYGTAGDMANALKMQEPGAQGYEELAAKDPTPERKRQASTMLGDLAWYQLLNKKPQDALQNARKATELDPAQPMNRSQVAHALLLTGQTAEAKAIYEKEKDTPLGGDRTFRIAALEEMNAIEKFTGREPRFDEIRSLYGYTAVAAAEGTPAKKKPSELMVWLIVGGIFCAVGSIFVILLLFENRRTKALAAAVARLGHVFREKATEEDNLLPQGSMLQTIGRNHAVRNIIEVPGIGSNCRLFEFSHTQGTGQRAVTHTQTMFRVESPRLNLPVFTLTPENAFTKIAQSFGAKDLQIEGREKFNAMFKFAGPDEAAIRQVFTPQVLDHLEQQSGLCVEGAGNRLFLYRRNVRAKVDKLEAFIEEGKVLMQLFEQASPAAPPPLG